MRSCDIAHDAILPLFKEKITNIYFNRVPQVTVYLNYLYQKKLQRGHNGRGNHVGGQKLEWPKLNVLKNIKQSETHYISQVPECTLHSEL